jgi:hypothetical protein
VVVVVVVGGCWGVAGEGCILGLGFGCICKLKNGLFN